MGMHVYAHQHHPPGGQPCPDGAPTQPCQGSVPLITGNDWDHLNPPTV